MQKNRPSDYTGGVYMLAHVTIHQLHTKAIILGSNPFLSLSCSIFLFLLVEKINGSSPPLPGRTSLRW